LSVSPWAPFRATKAAIKLHTLLDLCGNIPSFLHISDGKLRDVNVLDLLVPEPGAFYIMDRGYIDFERLYRLHETGSFLCDACQIQSQSPASLFPSGRSEHRADLRLDRALTGFYSRQDFDTPNAPHQVQRPLDRQTAGVPD
jgi:hypothetical protein